MLVEIVSDALRRTKIEHNNGTTSHNNHITELITQFSQLNAFSPVQPASSVLPAVPSFLQFLFWTMLMMWQQESGATEKLLSMAAGSGTRAKRGWTTNRQTITLLASSTPSDPRDSLCVPLQLSLLQVQRIFAAGQNGDLDEVKRLLEQDPTLLNARGQV
jgi:hypothetical protein